MNDMEVYHMMHQDVRRVSRRMARKYNLDADDVSQEAWYRIYKTLRNNDMSSVKRPRNYFFSAMRTGMGIAVRFARGGESNDELTWQNEPSATPSHQFLISSRAFRGVTRERLELLARYYCRGDTEPEIAAETGKSRQAVSQAHKLAIQKIRKNLGVEA